MLITSALCHLHATNVQQQQQQQRVAIYRFAVAVAVAAVTINPSTLDTIIYKCII